MSGRFKKIEGLNYKKGAVEYPFNLAASDRYHLLTKPFYNLANKISRWTGDGLDEDTRRHFCDFANIAQALALPAGSSILDVGCGAGWLCEYFARLGYKMTGLDLSPELIRIAGERIARNPFGVDEGTPLSCQFLVHDIEQMALEQPPFDAVICYDSLHHFEDENAVLRHISQMLAKGGLFFVAEGEMPPTNSESEGELREVMERFETLEAPFSREYLLDLLRQHGFAIVGDYVEVPGFVDRDNVVGNSVRFIEPPSFNYLLCKKIHHSGEDTSLPDSREPGRLLAKFSVQNQWREEISSGARIEVELKIENIGDTMWLVGKAPLKGRIRLGLKILDEVGQVIEETHGCPQLQKAVAPGETITIKASSQAPAIAGRYVLKLDLLDQDIRWFEQDGSKPLLLPFTVGRTLKS